MPGLISLKKPYPTWAMPLLGAGIGFYLGLKSYHRGASSGPIIIWLLPLVGLLGGLVIWGIDLLARRHQPREAEDEHLIKVEIVEPPGSQTGSIVLSVLALLSACIPVIGLGVGLAAVVMSVNGRGWVRSTGFMAFLISLYAHTIFVVVFFMAAGVIPKPPKKQAGAFGTTNQAAILGLASMEPGNAPPMSGSRDGLNRITAGQASSGTFSWGRSIF